MATMIDFYGNGTPPAHQPSLRMSLLLGSSRALDGGLLLALELMAEAQSLFVFRVEQPTRFLLTRAWDEDIHVDEHAWIVRRATANGLTCAASLVRLSSRTI
jgi:hypothetical protein